MNIWLHFSKASPLAAGGISSYHIFCIIHFGESPLSFAFKTWEEKRSWFRVVRVFNLSGWAKVPNEIPGKDPEMWISWEMAEDLGHSLLWCGCVEGEEEAICKRVWVCKAASKCVSHAAQFIHHAFLRKSFPCLARAYYHRNIIEHFFLCFRPMRQLPSHWNHNRRCLHITFWPVCEARMGTCTFAFRWWRLSSPQSPVCLTQPSLGRGW